MLSTEIDFSTWTEQELDELLHWARKHSPENYSRIIELLYSESISGFLTSRRARKTSPSLSSISARVSSVSGGS